MAPPPKLWHPIADHWALSYFTKPNLPWGGHTSWIRLPLIVLNVWTVVGVSLFLLNQHFRIKCEEDFLEERSGAQYRKYREPVGWYFWKILGAWTNLLLNFEGLSTGGGLCVVTKAGA
jgi:hypothetical protein